MMMTIAQIDTWFPYICFAYGAVMTLVQSSRMLGRLAELRLPQALQDQRRVQRGFSFLCLLVGAAWILQNLWLT